MSDIRIVQNLFEFIGSGLEDPAAEDLLGSDIIFTMTLANIIYI